MNDQTIINLASVAIIFIFIINFIKVRKVAEDIKSGEALTDSASKALVDTGIHAILLVVAFALLVPLIFGLIK